MFSPPQFAHCLVLLFTSACLVEAVETIPVHGWAPQKRKPPLSVSRRANNSNERKGTFHNSSYPSIRYVSGAAAATVFCSSGRRGKGRGGKKKTLRSADSVCMQYRRAPVRRRGEGKKGKVKGVGDRKREGKKTTHPLSVARESPKG